MNVDVSNKDLLKLYTEESGSYKRSLPPVVIDRFFETMGQICAADDERTLRTLKGRRLEKVPSECEDCYSMRLNDQYRLILRLKHVEGVPCAEIIDVRDYH
jgi:proteic killer suppression protein